MKFDYNIPVGEVTITIKNMILKYLNEQSIAVDATASSTVSSYLFKIEGR
jgi:hypothetical protein